MSSKKLSPEMFRKMIEDDDEFYNSYLEYAEIICNERNRYDKLRAALRLSGDNPDGLV